MELDLALSGSGVRFGAHLGAIKALEELDYKVVRIVGSSGGAIAGGLYATGVSIDAIIDEWSRLDLKKFRKFNPWRMFKDHGIFSNKYIGDRIDEISGGMKLKDARVEFHATATGERFGLKVWNKDTAPEMTIGEAARMSSAFPFYYQRIRRGDDAYTDGGWLKNYPIDYFKSDRKVLGLKVQGSKSTKRKLSKTVVGMGKNLFKADMEHKEHEYIAEAYWARTIQINTGKIGIMDFGLSKEDRKFLVKSGYDTVMKYRSKI